MLYKSAHHALQEAFRVLGAPIIKLSSINTMTGSMSGRAPGELSPQERHGQAAMTISIIEKAVDVNGMAYLKAYYGAELRGGEDERAVVNLLVRAVIASMGTGNCNPRGIERLVRIYFGQDIAMNEVRRAFGCGLHRANEYKDATYDALDKIAMRADYDADAALRVAGLIIEEEVMV